MSKFISSDTSAQLKYQVVFCFWQFSLIPELAKEFLKMPEVFTNLVESMRKSEKMKYLRIAVSFLTVRRQMSKKSGIFRAYGP